MFGTSPARIPSDGSESPSFRWASRDPCPHEAREILVLDDVRVERDDLGVRRPRLDPRSSD